MRRLSISASQALACALAASSSLGPGGMKQTVQHKFEGFFGGLIH
jgi:hypothetical protein